MHSSSTTTAATHQAKRPYAGSHSQSQYQSSITSYFSLSPSQYSLPLPSSIRNDINSSTSAPSLPPLVQSNLLSVGMRVRKSVPEGYKTGLTRKHISYGSSSGGAAAAAGGWGGSPDSAPAPLPTASTTARTVARRELTPFCGILKVGGMAVQSWDLDEEQPSAAAADDDDVPFLSSQGSTLSTVSTRSTASRTGYKRRFDEADEDEAPRPPLPPAERVEYDDGSIWRDVDDGRGGDGEDDVPLSPKTRPVDLGLGFGRRVMAVPKSRRRSSSGVAVVKSAVLEGQENRNQLGVVDVDFGEAEFMDWSSCLG